MFSRKNCGRCGARLKAKYSFCPYCGSVLEKKEEDFGMLGKDDSLDSFSGTKFPTGFNMIFNSLMRNLENQMNNRNKNTKPEQKKGNINITISTFAGNPPMLNIGQNPASPVKPQKPAPKKQYVQEFSPDKLKKFSNLPREEPKTNIRRLSNKVLYEVELPGVKSVKDISILNLNNGIELKALSDKRAYSKSIPINMPITKYKLSNGKLTLEMNAL